MNNKILHSLFFTVVFFFLVLLITLSSVTASAQNRSVNLLKNELFEKVQALAKKEQKLIFLDFGSPRCSPCLFMKNNIFTIDSVADFVNKHFISADYTEGPEKIRLSEIYQVSSEPVFLILDSNGNLMHRTQGKSTADEMLERFRQGMDRENNLVALNARYDSGNREEDFLLYYINTLHIAGLRDKRQEVLLNIFHSDFDLDSLYAKEYWDIFLKFDESPESRQTLFLMDNIRKFAEIYGSKEVLAKIDRIYFRNSIIKRLNTNKAKAYALGNKNPTEDPNFLTTLKETQSSNHPNSPEWLAYLVPASHKFSNWHKMAKEIESVIIFNILKGSDREHYIKMMSEQFAWYCTDASALSYPIKWIDAMLEYTTDVEIIESIKGTRESVVKKIEELSK